MVISKASRRRSVTVGTSFNGLFRFFINNQFLVVRPARPTLASRQSFQLPASLHKKTASGVNANTTQAPKPSIRYSATSSVLPVGKQPAAKATTLRQPLTTRNGPATTSTGMTATRQATSSRNPPSTRYNVTGRATHTFGQQKVLNPVARASLPTKPVIDYKKMAEELAVVNAANTARIAELQEILTVSQGKLAETEAKLTQEMLITTNLKSLKEHLETKNAEQKQTLEEKEQKLREQHDEIVNLKGQIRVVVRIRSKLVTEEEMPADLISYPTVKSVQVTTNKTPSVHTFESVVKPSTRQETLFKDVISDIVTSVLHGYNVGLIAFGQTGSGKTYTMRGGSGVDEGIIPRAVTHLKNESDKLAILGYEFDFSVSYVEVYNNEIFDLFANRAKLNIRVTNNDVTMTNVQETKMTSIQQMKSLLQVADRSRKTAATKCNAVSSRSHAIFVVRLTATKDGETYSSVLKCVDLAGSERAKESGAEGAVFKEMTAINQSLSCLQRCISLQRTKSSTIPYRDSVLTLLLRDCLGGGNSKTMMLVTVSPLDENISETKRTLEFASKMSQTTIGAASKN